MQKGGKKYYAKFCCGHSAYIRYYGRTDLLKKLKKIEEGEPCPDCKRKEFIKTAIAIDVPYWEYKNLYHNKRGVVAGEYNKQTNKITLYMTPKMSAKYKEEHNKVYYDVENAGIDENGMQMISVFIKGSSYRLKEELKKMGFVFSNRHWRKLLVVFPQVYNDDGNKHLPVQDNPEFYAIIKQLEEMDVINNIVSLQW